jgi:hypothetical protein
MQLVMMPRCPNTPTHVHRWTVRPLRTTAIEDWGTFVCAACGASTLNVPDPEGDAPMPTSLMLTARLHTATGHHVAAVEVPPFETGFPPALVFGTRFYLRAGSADQGSYLETFCYTATVEVRTADNAKDEAQ